MKIGEALQPIDVRRGIRGFHRAGCQNAVDKRGAFRFVQGCLDANTDDAPCSRNQHRAPAVSAAGITANFHMSALIVPQKRTHPHHERLGSVADQHQRIANLRVFAKRRLQCRQPLVGDERHHHNIETAIGAPRTKTNDARCICLTLLLEDELSAITVASCGEPVLIRGAPTANPIGDLPYLRPNDESSAETLIIDDEPANRVSGKRLRVCCCGSPDDSTEQDQHPEHTQDLGPAPSSSRPEVAISPQTPIRRGEYWLHGLYASAGSAGCFAAYGGRLCILPLIST